MNTVELLQHAQGTAFRILNQVAADVTQQQADWVPPGIANPIGATYWHAVSTADRVVHGWGMGQDPLSQRDGWQEKVLTVPAPEPERGGEEYRAYMRTIRVDISVLRDYAEAVVDATQSWLSCLTPKDVERQIETPFGELQLGEALQIFLIWHLTAHCGEIASLKGCQGAMGYRF
jgi:hypothetical protein